MLGPGSVGSIGWVDLTVEDAAAVRDFYAAVVGWRPQPVPMDGYEDFNMTDPESGEPRAGVCFRRGTNADLPPSWIVYFVVADLAASVERCKAHGGRVISGPRSGFCVVQDPAGAVCALYQRAG